jgi:hypothetical protein
MTADPTTTDLADRAAQAVRELNHRTRGADAFTGPAQLYRLVGDLSLLTGMLPQLLGHLEDWLQTEHDADRIRSDNRGDPGPVVCAATTYLADAGDAAHDLADLLNSAQQYLATLGSAPPRHDPKCNPGRRAKDLADLAAGRETGWWDEKGRPAPWPDDFFDPDSDWCIGGIDDDDPPVALAPGEAPF